MRRSLLYLFISASTLLLTSCDEGDIIDAPQTNIADSRTVKFTATLSGLEAWSSDYDVVVAAFDGESDYALIQKHVTASEDGRSELILSGVPSSASTVEFCVTNKLRRRILTFESLTIAAAEQAVADTLRLSVEAPMNVGMFASIQRHIFDGAAYNCSLCHGAENARASLDLSYGHSAASLVGVPSARVEGGVRVVPGNSASSVLHQALSEGNPAGLRYDHSGLVDELARRLIDDWIDGGAKE